MTAVFTTFFREQLFNSLDKVAPLDPNANLMAGKSVHWVYFRTHAAFLSTQDARYTGIKTISDLAGMQGWSPPIAPPSATQVVGCTTVADNTYVVANNKFVNGGGWQTSTVTAAALILEGSHGGTTDPIIYLTDTPFEGGVVMHQEDSLIGRPVPALGGNRSLFAWPVWFTGMIIVQPVEGSMAVLLAPPPFEASYTQHAWLYPQRVNMIANPGFETNPGTNHWRTNGTFVHVQSTLSTPPVTTDLPSAPGGGLWYGKVTGTPPLVAESNYFPLHHYATVRDLWTIQAMVRGSGKVRVVGLLGWEDDFAATAADWGDEVWTIPPKGWLHLYALRHSYENVWGMVRIECDGSEMHLDNILCEPDWLNGWPYFDGDSTYGARDDYSWYGGENRKGTTYSCWYNHRRAVVGRLFAWDIPTDDFTVTDEEVESQGFVYKWIPAGVRVTPHLDVLWADDIQEVVPNNAGTPTTPLDTGTNGGVSNAWAPFQYLAPLVGTVSTPDPGPMPTKCTLVFHVDKAGAHPNSDYGGIASQWLDPFKWLFMDRDTLQIQTTSSPPRVLGVLGESETTVAVSTDFTVTSHPSWVWTLRNGQWSRGDAVTTPDVPPPTNNPQTLYIGAASGTWGVFNGRIYSVEMRTGLDPTQGKVLWRFDATEYPGSGTTYTDPRGRVWTLANAGVIGRA